MTRIPQEELDFGQRTQWLQQHEHATIAASDGSLTANGMGAAATLLTGGQSIENREALEGDPDITKAELYGLRLAIQASPPDRHLIVLTDSAGALSKLEEANEIHLGSILYGTNYKRPSTSSVDSSTRELRPDSPSPWLRSADIRVAY